jgi:hypothetical protein
MMFKINDNVQNEVAKYISYKRKQSFMMDVFEIICVVALVLLCLKLFCDICNLSSIF